MFKAYHEIHFKAGVNGLENGFREFSVIFATCGYFALVFCVL
jgi:hypothetical protein